MLDHSRLIVIAALLAGAGATLLLSHLRWFRQESLTNRLAPFLGGQPRRNSQTAQRSIVQIALPVFSANAERIARSMGINESLSTRLQRASWPVDPQAFRLRQFGWASAALGFGLLASIAFRPPAPLIVLLIAGAPFLAFLVVEQHLNNAIRTRQNTLFCELPVVSEQLAMLLSAGYSVGGALNRLAERNGGASGDDLRQVCERIRLGLSTSRALKEWSDNAAIPELDRVVAILTLSDETGDLGRLVADEAAGIRREAQRQLVETIERRGQQVWIPVTVATLVPGVIFLIIPFLQALQIFSAT